MTVEIDSSVVGTRSNPCESEGTGRGGTEVIGNGVGTACRGIKDTCEVNGSVVGAGTCELIHDSEVFGFVGIGFFIPGFVECVFKGILEGT